MHSGAALLLILLDVVAIWPTASTTAKNTGTVLLCSLVVGACIWIFDYVAVSAVHLLIGLAG